MFYYNLNKNTIFPRRRRRKSTMTQLDPANVIIAHFVFKTVSLTIVCAISAYQLWDTFPYSWYHLASMLTFIAWSIIALFNIIFDILDCLRLCYFRDVQHNNPTGVCQYSIRSWMEYVEFVALVAMFVMLCTKVSGQLSGLIIIFVGLIVLMLHIIRLFFQDRIRTTNLHRFNVIFYMTVIPDNMMVVRVSEAKTLLGEKHERDHDMKEEETTLSIGDQFSIDVSNYPSDEDDEEEDEYEHAHEETDDIEMEAYEVRRPMAINSESQVSFQPRPPSGEPPKTTTSEDSDSKSLPLVVLSGEDGSQITTPAETDHERNEGN